MNIPTFQIRIKEKTEPSQMIKRVEEVLNCKFKKIAGEEFQGSEAGEAFALGLRITLAGSYSPETKIYTYWLTGGPQNNLIVPPPANFKRLKINDYILLLFARNDSGDWYSISEEELLNEAGVQE